MYATLSYDVSAGQHPIADIRQSLSALFAGRQTLDMLSDTLVCDIAKTADYLAVTQELEKIGTDFAGQFQFVFTLHSAKAPIRSNAAFSRQAARDIIS